MLREDDPQNLLDRLVVLEGQEEFDRPLADVARAPSRTGVLLEPARHRQMDHCVVRKPRQRRIERRGLRSFADDSDSARDRRPELHRRRNELAVLPHLLVL